MLFSIGGLPLRVFLGFFARSSYRFRRSLKHRLLASQIAAKLLLGSEDRHPDRRKKLPFQCARDLGVTHLFVVARHERHLLFSGQPNQLFSTSSCSSLRRTWESGDGVEWSGTSIRSVPSTHAPFSRFLCRSLSMQCRPVTFDTQGAEGQRLISCLQDFVQLQKDLCRRILGVFRLTKETPADPQNMAIVSRVDLCLMLRGRFVEAGSAPRRAVFLP